VGDAAELAAWLAVAETRALHLEEQLEVERAVARNAVAAALTSEMARLQAERRVRGWMMNNVHWMVLWGGEDQWTDFHRIPFLPNCPNARPFHSAHRSHHTLQGTKYKHQLRYLLQAAVKQQAHLEATLAHMHEVRHNKLNKRTRVGFEGPALKPKP
jgi:hypothetical protein